MKITRTAEVRVSILLLVVAVLLAGVSLLLFVRPLLQPRGEEVAAAPPENRAAAHVAMSPAPRAKPVAPKPAVHLEPLRSGEEAAEVAAPSAEKPHAATPAAAANAAPGQNPEPQGAGDEENDEPSGIALFPPPGTNPPRSGIIVPDDFELPPGYMRHYQSTDDGKQLAPILVFHPDFQLVDADGRPVPMPADRVVPADLAPPGLAIEMLQVPDSQGAGGDGDVDPGQQDTAP